ncbi:MAG: ribonuclease J [Anaerolineae bacterium]|nr:ribonuclease J [Anaerolineae bacterium]MCX8067834.1 ribonuclease J [Anaerolineae bacterium]MDW7990780.1 ribonuclease J [Anaerolineae bacterium]
MSELRIIPLGGLGEVGKNMMAVEYGRDILVVDAGLMFPESDMFGVDYIIPDYGYLRDKRDRVLAVVITHGHEDHIGALPHFLQEFPVPVYATRLTLGLIEVKLRQAHLLQSADLRLMNPGDLLEIGPFRVEPFHVCHSIPDTVGLGITTPAGLIVHSGDFKFDHTPVDGQPTDFAKLAEFAGRGVLVLLSDSTNSTEPGTTPSEQVVTEALDDIMRRATGRVILATFASLISRIQQAVDVALRYGRKVAIAGATMADNVKMALRLGYLRIPEGTLVSLGEMENLPPSRCLILATGAQGEPTAVLTRLALGQHPSLRVRPGDTVVLSSHTIPGNEELIHRVINRLFQKGADVVYHPLAPVHVSGHASQEEQKLLLNILRPRNFVPIHGELRHLKQHAKLAMGLGIPAERIAVVENGYVLSFRGDQIQVGERVPGGYVFVDGTWVGDAVGPAVIRDRETLAMAGVCVAAFHYDPRRGTLIGSPRLTMRGFVASHAAEEILAEAQDVVRRVVRDVRPGTPAATVEHQVQSALAEFFYQRTKNRPEVIVIAVTD